MFYLNPHILRPLFLLLNCCYDVQSIGFFDFEEHSRVEIVVFSNQHGFARRQAFDWLYFSEPFLTVRCQLRYRDNDTDDNRNFLVKKYASQGMSPSLTLSSPTLSKTFEFAALVHEEKWTYWIVNISKTEDFKDISFHRKLRWKFKVELQKGLNLFEAQGNLVVSDTEPVLNVELGDTVSAESILLPTPPSGVMLWHSPCTWGVAALVPLLNVSDMPFKGCYMAITYAGFSSNSTRWYDLLHLSSGTPDAYSVCKAAEFSSCSNLAILDFTIVHNYMLVVTTKGLIRSQQMNEALQDPENPKLKFHAVQTGHPVLDKLFEASVQPMDIKLHHTVHCFGHLNTERSRVYLRFSPKQINDQLPQSVVLVSEAPFMQWTALEFYEPMANLPVMGLVEDFQRQTTIMLLYEVNQAQALVAVQEFKRDMRYFHPAYRFPAYVTFIGMTLHSYTNALFTYGSQVWQSLDGGNTFHKIIELRPLHDLVSSFSLQDYGDSFTCVTHLGRSYHGKAGMRRAVPLELGSKLSNRSLKTFIMKQQSGVYLLTLPDASNLLSLKSESLDLKSYFVKLGGFFYGRPLLVRLITAKHVELFTYCKDAFFSSQLIRCNGSFHSSDIGRVLRTRRGTAVTLDNVSTKPKANGFSGRAIGHLLSPVSFDDAIHTPALRYALELNWSESNATLVLLNVINGAGWKGEDVGKTVYFPDSIALIVSTYVNASIARAHSQSRWTNSSYFVKVYPAGLWNLIDFRPFDARRSKEGQVLCVGNADVGHAPIGVSGGTFFLNSDVGKVLKAGQGWGFVTSVTSGSTATVNIRQAMNGNHTGNWGVYEANATKDGGAPKAQELWWLGEDECRQFLVKDSNSEPSFYHLDSNENLSLTVRAISKSMSDVADTKPLLRMFIGNASLFVVESHYSFSKLNHSLRVTIKQRPYVSGESSVTFRLDHTSLLCKDSSYVVMIYGGCPPTKKLIFSYPLSLTEDFLHREVKDSKGIVRNIRLPYNYRPPSSRGTGIPMSENIYNVYPEKAPYRSAYAITRETARYKQCAGKEDRQSCECTTATRMSSLVLHSDCIDTVYRVLFTDTLKPRFTVFEEGPLKFPYYLEELNGRSDFEIISPHTAVFATISYPIMHQELNSSIEFQGSGLYHFRAHVVQENYTFCNLNDEFLVYVDETPLPSPVNDIVRACTGMAFTAMLYIVYLLTFHGKKKMKNG